MSEKRAARRFRVCHWRLLHRAGRQADQHHEDRDQGEREQHGEAADPVLPPHHEHDHRRRDDGQHELGQVAAEVRVEGVESAAGGDGQLGGVAGRQPARSESPDRVGQGRAQLRLHAGGRPGTRPFAQPQQRGARGERGQQPHQGGGQRGQRHPVDHARDRARQQPRDRDDHGGLREPDDGDQREERARGSGVAQQPRVHGPEALARRRPRQIAPHALNARPTAAAFSMRVRVTRLRKIQYVQAW